jgi:hypothetical protein
MIYNIGVIASPPLHSHVDDGNNNTTIIQSSASSSLLSTSLMSDESSMTGRLLQLKAAAAAADHQLDVVVGPTSSSADIGNATIAAATRATINHINDSVDAANAPSYIPSHADMAKGAYAYGSSLSLSSNNSYHSSHNSSHQSGNSNMTSMTDSSQSTPSYSAFVSSLPASSTSSRERMHSITTTLAVNHNMVASPYNQTIQAFDHPDIVIPSSASTTMVVDYGTTSSSSPSSLLSLGTYTGGASSSLPSTSSNGMEDGVGVMTNNEMNDTVDARQPGSTAAIDNEIIF